VCQLAILTDVVETPSNASDHGSFPVASAWPKLPREGGLFVMLDVRKLGIPSDEVRRFLLREAGVVVLHGAAYGPGGEGTLRVSFAAGGETLERGLERLRDGLLRLAVQSRGEGEARMEVLSR